jgi:hypothetical protein
MIRPDSLLGSVINEVLGIFDRAEPKGVLRG